MKRFATIAALAAWAALPALADPLEGHWRTAPDDNGNSGLIEVAPCGDALCGTLVEAYDASGARIDSPNIGRHIISATKPRGEGRYRGRVWSPDRDKTYNSRLRLQGDRLSVSGCVMAGLICRDGGTWRRVE